MTSKLTYNQFRSAHKGTPKKELSALWSEYKEGTYSFPAQEEPETQEQSVIEASVEEETPVTEEATEEIQEVEESEGRLLLPAVAQDIHQAD